MNILDIYEEVSDFIDNLQDILYDVPEFELGEECEDYIKETIEICNSWLEDNKEKYLKEVAREENALNGEYERIKLGYGILENKKESF